MISNLDFTYDGRPYVGEDTPLQIHIYIYIYIYIIIYTYIYTYISGYNIVCNTHSCGDVLPVLNVCQHGILRGKYSRVLLAELHGLYIVYMLVLKASRM